MKSVRMIGLFSLIFSLIFTHTAHAQTSCNSVTILNESTTVLDEQAICAAGEAFAVKGHQVFVFVTDAPAGSENDWFSIRDRVEEGWGIYNPSTQEFSIRAVSIELTTDTSKPWGQDIAFGEQLFGTALDSDNSVNAIEGQLKNTVAEGGNSVTQGIVNAFNSAYELGYPPPTVTPPPQPTSPPQPTVVVVAGPTTNVNVDLKPLFSGLLILLSIGVLIAAIVLVWIRIVAPVLRDYQERKKLEAQIALLKSKLGPLANTTRQMFGEAEPQNTLMYAMWAANGGQKYTELDGNVLEYIRRAQAALGKALEGWQKLSDKTANSNPERRQLIGQLELMYLTIVGTQKEVLALNDMETAALMDPTVAIPQGFSDVQLVSQMDKVVQELKGAGTLNVKMLVARTEGLDQKGIFGYVWEIKSALHQVKVAQDNGPKALEEAKKHREEVGAPFKLAAVAETLTINPFTHADKLLALAEVKAQAELWLDVQKLCEQATVSMDNVPSVVKEYVAVLAYKVSRDSELQSFRDQKYRFPKSAEEAIAETTQDIKIVLQSLVEGNYARAHEYVREINVDSTRAVEEVKKRIALQTLNKSELKRLSVEVAEAEKTRIEKVQAVWEKLQQYPNSNWGDVATAFAETTNTLKDLFDNPSDANDLASKIALANSIEQQLFDDANKMLVEAFVRLEGVKHRFTRITTQLADVQKYEKEIQEQIVKASESITRATARRDADDAKIDKTVDENINMASRQLALAKGYQEKREFTLADKAANEAFTRATESYRSANEQATGLDDLSRTLATLKVSAEANVQKALTEHARLTPAAQKASTGGKAMSAQRALHEAQSMERKINGEDRVLASTTSLAVEAYKTADRMAKEALQKIQADANEYNHRITTVKSNIESASGYISTASRYVSDSGGTGRSALERARNMIPTSPQYGDTTDLLQQKESDAQEAAAEAKRARREAEARIEEIEEERAAERRRQQAEQDRREAQRRSEEAARQRAEDNRRSSSYSSSSSSRSSSSMSSSSSSGRSSSMGSSSRR